MSAYRPDDAPSDLRRRDLAPRTSGRGNRSAARPVVQVVGKSRAFVAAVVAAGVVLSGCASADGGEETSTTTSPAAAEEPGNPWDLPIEQRPALFDPCSEIPVEAIEEGVGSPVKPVEEYRRQEPGSLMACGWANEEIDLSILSTWKSREDYLADTMFIVGDSTEAYGRSGFRLLDSSDPGGRSCIQMFFTERGAIWVKIDLFGMSRNFQGDQYSNSCEALDTVIAPVVSHIPEGNS